VLQFCDWEFVVGHAVPPWRGAVFVRLRVCVPVPQSLLHLLHSPQTPTSQLTGQ
jgi:hypothetical protein